MSCLRRNIRAISSEPALLLALLAIIATAAWTLPNLASGRCTLNHTQTLACHEQSGGSCATAPPAASLYSSLTLSRSETLDTSEGSGGREREARLLAGGMNTAPLRTRTATSSDLRRPVAAPRTDWSFGPSVTSQTPQSASSGFMPPLLA